MLSQRKISLIYIVTGTLLLVGLVPLLLTGWFLSGRSATELRAVENRYQIQLVHEKARQIEMFSQRYGDLVKGLVNTFELLGGTGGLSSSQSDERLSTTLRENPGLVALYVRPPAGEPVSLFRANTLSRAETEKVASEAIQSITDSGPLAGEPFLLATGEPAVTMTARSRNGGAVVAVISFRDLARSIVGTNAVKDEELWANGLPIIFVVDHSGRAIFHPDPQLASGRRSLADLRIVEEWTKSNSQIQSGLLPFTADYRGDAYEMIGAYSTVAFGGKKYGVITMQDERKALASVAEMKTQTWLISLAFALVALVLGTIAARTLASPILKLSAAAQRIAAGDLSTRVETRNITEIGTLGESFNTMSDKLEEHIARLAHAAKENRELFVGTVKALAAAIDGKDKYTLGHSERVARISVAIGKQLALPEDELETLRISALLHDVGKIAIDDSILKKTSALTQDEFEIMKTHPQRGYKIMSQIPAMKDFLPGMYMHHEMVNGAGYPQGLKGDEIPLQAKIVSVADTFDAITIDRPYQKGMLLPDAIKRIQSFVGTRYDPKVVDALLRGCEAGEIGRGLVQFLVKSRRSETLADEAGDEDDVTIPPAHGPIGTGETNTVL